MIGRRKNGKATEIGGYVVSLLAANTAKKWLRCLGCGRKMYTDRCHRFCRKCLHRNDAASEVPWRRVALPEGLDLRQLCASEGGDW